MLKLPPRRVLWAILAVVFIGGCGLYYWPVMEVRIPGRFEGIPRTSRDMPYLTDQQKQETEEIIRASGIVELVNGGQGQGNRVLFIVLESYKMMLAVGVRSGVKWGE